MHTRTLFAILSVVGLVATASVEAAERGEAKLSVSGKAVSVGYGRPSLAGRDMLGRAPLGSEWRLGADSPTALKTEADLDFSGKKVLKGDYVLRARRDSDSAWTLLVRKGETLVAEVPLAHAAVKDSVETLTIDLKPAAGGGELVITWGTSALSAKFAAK